MKQVSSRQGPQYRIWQRFNSAASSSIKWLKPSYLPWWRQPPHWAPPAFLHCFESAGSELEFRRQDSLFRHLCNTSAHPHPIFAAPPQHKAGGCLQGREGRQHLNARDLYQTVRLSIQLESKASLALCCTRARPHRQPQACN